MRDRWKTARVGLMVFVGLLAIFAVYRYVDEQSSAGEGYSVFARFDDVQGLIEKSRVLVAGIPVGTIESIRLDGDRAKVTMRIRPDVPLHEDASVAMRSVSLLGEKILVINPGTPTLPSIPDGGEIRVVREGVSTDDIMVTVNDITQNVRDVTRQLARSFGTDEAGQRMESALRNLSEALEGINRTIQDNEEAVGNALHNIEDITEEAGPRIVRILDNVEQATGNVRTLLDERHDDLDRGLAEVDDTIASIHAASDQLESVFSDIRQVTDRTARGEGTIGRLTSDETLIDEIEGVAEGLGNVVGGYARLQTIVELRNEYAFLSNTFKTYFSIYLKPREDRYFLIQIVDDPRGRISRTQTTVTTSPPLPGEPRRYTERRTTRSDAVVFTFMLAKRISFATLRYGIMESTGGLGLDFHLVDDRLEINTDMFAFGQAVFPRLRVRMLFEVVSRLWVIAGVDDALNDDYDFFMGLQLRFNDEDLKGLLPFMGGLRP